MSEKQNPRLEAALANPALIDAASTFRTSGICAAN